MTTEKHNYLQLIKANQWASRVFINGDPITITVKDIFVKNSDEFTEFIDQNNEHRILRSELIEVPTFTMD
ncbi:hypothetical protein HOE22_08005 [Candidatus Woesearchaeota archaeon]|jgi:hypothetical protein|nr:hypothetical protein [Candidatus Woesearchaeota archaeon]MBT4764863.1 hypothetical protein [bacterium]